MRCRVKGQRLCLHKGDGQGNTVLVVSHFKVLLEASHSSVSEICTVLYMLAGR